MQIYLLNWKFSNFNEYKFHIQFVKVCIAEITFKNPKQSFKTFFVKIKCKVAYLPIICQMKDNQKILNCVRPALSIRDTLSNVYVVTRPMPFHDFTFFVIPSPPTQAESSQPTLGIWGNPL